ncbi:MAG: helix-turn-helix transcriptional regulator [Acidobacteria bacterium]|nr:helix-turn-helix transcriptional regulator [Acidobacteriota bacterium]
MAPHSFYILMSLADENRHGSGIMREVLEITRGEVRLWPVKLYSTLDELAKAAGIEELAGAGEHPEGRSRKRRYYRITEAGRAALAAETQRLHGLVAIAWEGNAAGGSPAGEG